LLGDIPLLGNLFKSRATDITRTNLMVFIHPVILRDSSVASRYTNSKYNYIRALQMGEDAEGVDLMPGKSQPVLPEIGEFGALPGKQDAAQAPAQSVDGGTDATNE
jgi:general secretion pathway protein D